MRKTYHSATRFTKSPSTIANGPSSGRSTGFFYKTPWKMSQNMLCSGVILCSTYLGIYLPFCYAFSLLLSYRLSQHFFDERICESPYSSRISLSPLHCFSRIPRGWRVSRLTTASAVSNFFHSDGAIQHCRIVSAVALHWSRIVTNIWLSHGVVYATSARSSAYRDGALSLYSASRPYCIPFSIPAFAFVPCFSSVAMIVPFRHFTHDRSSRAWPYQPHFEFGINQSSFSLRMAADYGLFPVYKKEFHQVFEEHQDHPDFKPLLVRMKVVDDEGASAMNEDQWEAASQCLISLMSSRADRPGIRLDIYIAFAFEKR